MDNNNNENLQQNDIDGNNPNNPNNVSQQENSFPSQQNGGYPDNANLNPNNINQSNNGYNNPNGNGYPYNVDQSQSNYYNPNQTQGGYNYNPNQNQNSNGNYYDPNQYQNQNNYYNPYPNQNPNGYYNPNQPQNGYGNNSQYNYGNYGQYGGAQWVYPNVGAAASAPSAEVVAKEKRAFNITIIKLAIFVMIVVLNTNFLYGVFYYPAVWIVQSMGSETSLELLYFISWFTNDLCAYLFPALAAFLLFRKELREKISYIPHPNVSVALNSGLTFLAACFLGSLAGFLANFIAAILDTLYGTGEIPDAMESSVPPQGEMGSFWVMLFFVAVVAPVFEELIFRKLLLYPLRRHGDWFAIIVTALIFGFYHGNFDQMPYAFVVGMLFALLAVNTNSVIPSMILHVLNNALVTISQYLVPVTGETEPALSISNWVSEGLSFAFWLGIPAVAMMIAGKLFKTANKPMLGAKDKAKLIFRNPAFYVFVVFTALMMVDSSLIIEVLRHLL